MSDGLNILRAVTIAAIIVIAGTLAQPRKITTPKPGPTEAKYHGFITVERPLVSAGLYEVTIRENSEGMSVVIAQHGFTGKYLGIEARYEGDDWNEVMFDVVHRSIPQERDVTRFHKPDDQNARDILAQAIDEVMQENFRK